MSESPVKKLGKKRPSTSSTDQESSASPKTESSPYESLVETLINETLSVMKPSSSNIEKKRLEDDIILVNMERPCCCEMCSIIAETGEKERNPAREKDQMDRQPTEEK